MSTHNICFSRETNSILCGYPLLPVAIYDCMVLHCTEPFIMTPSSQNDLNNVERDVTHQIITIAGAINYEILPVSSPCEILVLVDVSPSSSVTCCSPGLSPCLMVSPSSVCIASVGVTSCCLITVKELSIASKCCFSPAGSVSGNISPTAEPTQNKKGLFFFYFFMGHVKQKRGFSNVQNMWIHIILHMLKISSWPLVFIHTFCNVSPMILLV